MPWWYDLGSRRAPGPLPAPPAGSLHRRARARGARDADTIVVPGWHGDPSPAVIAAVARPTSAARGWSRSAAGSSSSPPRACSTAARRRRTRATPSGSPPGTRRRGQRRTCSTSTRARADVGGQRRGDRPVPAHRAPRPREQDRQRRRAAAGDPAAPRRRAGAADRRADAGPSRRRPDRVRDGVGAGAPRRAARPRRARGTRVHERPHVHAPVPEGDRHDPGRWLLEQRVRASLALLEALRRVDRDRGWVGRLRQRGDLPASLRRDHAHVADAYRRAFYAATA